MAKLKYELRQIDAWVEPCEDESGRPSWYWNDSFHLADIFVTDGASVERAFLRALHKEGFVCKRGCCKIVEISNGYELQNRIDDCPIFAFISMEF